MIGADALAFIFLLLLIVATGAAILAFAAVVGRRSAAPERSIPYECGLDPAQAPRGRPAIPYFLIAALFLIFDAEVVCLFPWAAAFRESAASGVGVLLIVEIAIFLGFIALALLFAWGRGALEWER